MPETKKRTVEVHTEQDAIDAMRQMETDLEQGFSSDLSLRPAPEYIRCDFCSMRPVEWTYPCEDFESVSLTEVRADGPVHHTHTSRGNWAACNACRDLIEDGRIEDLKRRMSTIQGFAGDALIEGVVFGQLQGFFEHRTGPAYREKEEKL